MAKHILYLRMEKYLRQWVLHKYGAEPISFPRWSKENDFLQDHLQRRPQRWKPEPCGESVSICVPKREGFKRSTWCYVPYYKLVLLRQMLQEKFYRAFFGYIALPNPIITTIKGRILAFMQANGIEEDISTLETLMKIQQRKRHLYEKPKDIDLKANKAHKGTRKKAK